MAFCFFEKNEFLYREKRVFIQSMSSFYQNEFLYSGVINRFARKASFYTVKIGVINKFFRKASFYTVGCPRKASFYTEKSEFLYREKRVFIQSGKSY